MLLKTVSRFLQTTEQYQHFQQKLNYFYLIFKETEYSKTSLSSGFSTWSITGESGV